MCVCVVILFVGETYIYVTNYSSTTFVHRVAFSLRCHFLASLLDVLFQGFPGSDNPIHHNCNELNQSFHVVDPFSLVHL